jgi:hypothetical protein
LVRAERRLELGIKIGRIFGLRILWQMMDALFVVLFEDAGTRMAFLEVRDFG